VSPGNSTFAGLEPTDTPIITMQQTFLQRLWQRIRRFGFELYAFFTAPFVAKNLLGMIGLLTGLFLLTFWWLKCYTNHGESLQVPSYVGMSYREAARKAGARDFAVAVSDSLYVPGKPPGEVLSQNPRAESRVKEGRTIYFTVAKNNPDLIRLPDLSSGDDYDIYSRKLSRLGLKPRILARVPDPKLTNTIMAVLYRGDTITRKIARGFTVEMGGTVDFIVSEEVTLTVNIPDCRCQTLAAAKFLIQTSNLSVGSIIADGTITDEQNAYVYRQKPAFDPNGTMRVGEQIDLYITQQRPKDCEGQPE
ncbi:MAG: PASTA domain-containing protein, partial [Saprospiraceae bacterium]|nr:PASTA domain-containing protein [Saprospiraceae bacterium]